MLKHHRRMQLHKHRRRRRCCIQSKMRIELLSDYLDTHTYTQHTLARSFSNYVYNLMRSKYRNT